MRRMSECKLFMGEGACASDASGARREREERSSSRAACEIRYSELLLCASIRSMQISSRDGERERIGARSTETLIEAVVAAANAPAERVSDASQSLRLLA